MANAMEGEEKVHRIDYYPTHEEIVNNLPLTRCDMCGRNFANASACRFHQVKQHLLLDNVTNCNERRLFTNAGKEPKIIQNFHCPAPLCKSKVQSFEGMRNLRQHYVRSHCAKNLVCEVCGFRTALEKDINYHIKSRCTGPPLSKEEEKKKKAEIKKKKVASLTKTLKEKKAAIDSTKNQKSTRKRRRSEDSDEDEDSSRSPPTTVVQPIFFVVNPENVDSVVETIQKKILNPSDINLNSIGRQEEEDVSNSQIPFEPNVAMASIHPVTSTSFATQYDPTEHSSQFCERGEDPLNFFDPPFGEEFGDLTTTPRNAKNDNYNYASQQSTSQQPQTRSFGTMFENVETCNTGTSMIEEEFPEFLRDIETQTPSYMIQGQHLQQPGTSGDWPWPMTEGDI